MNRIFRFIFILYLLFSVVPMCFSQINPSSLTESEKSEKIKGYLEDGNRCYKDGKWKSALDYYEYILSFLSDDIKPEIQKRIIKCKKNVAIENREFKAWEKARLEKETAEKEQLEKQHIEEEKERAEAENRRIENERTGIIIKTVAIIVLILLLIVSIRFVNSFNAKSEANKAKTQFIANIIASGLAVVIMCCIIFSCMQGGKSTSPSVNNYTVFVHAQDFVRARLACPSTARFPSQSEGIFKDLGNNVYGYAGYVDSQNVYGAMVRSKYYVEIEFTGDECRLLNITIE